MFQQSTSTVIPATETSLKEAGLAIMEVDSMMMDLNGHQQLIIAPCVIVFTRGLDVIPSFALQSNAHHPPCKMESAVRVVAVSFTYYCILKLIGKALNEGCISKSGQVMRQLFQNVYMSR